MKIEIEGVIEGIIYANEMNSYTVARFIAEEDVITIVGFLPFVNIGDTIIVTRRVCNS